MDGFLVNANLLEIGCYNKFAKQTLLACFSHCRIFLVKRSPPKIEVETIKWLNHASYFQKRPKNRKSVTFRLVLQL